MPIYVSSHDVVTFTDAIQSNGVYQSLENIIRSLQFGCVEDFYYPEAIIKGSQEHDREAVRKQSDLFSSWVVNIIATLMHCEAVSFGQAVWDKTYPQIDAVCVEGLRAHFIMGGVDPNLTMRLAAKKVDVEKFYMSLMQCNMVLKPHMIHEELNNSLAILGLPALPVIAKSPDVNEGRYCENLEKIKGMLSSPVPGIEGPNL